MTRDSIPKNSASIANRVFKELQVRKWNARGKECILRGQIYGVD